MDIKNQFMASNISINLATSVNLNEPIVNPKSNQFELPVEEEPEEEGEEEENKDTKEQNLLFKTENNNYNDNNQINFDQELYDKYLQMDSDSSTPNKYRSIGEVAAAALLKERMNHRRNAAILSDGKVLAIYQTQRKEEERKKINYQKRKPHYKFANTLKQNREERLYSQKRAQYEL